jgi:hypothetical protein
VLPSAFITAVAAGSWRESERPDPVRVLAGERFVQAEAADQFGACLRRRGRAEQGAHRIARDQLDREEDDDADPDQDRDRKEDAAGDEAKHGGHSAGPL